MTSASARGGRRATAGLWSALAVVAAVDLLKVATADGLAWAQFGPQAYAHAELDVDDSTALAFSPDERLLAVGDDDGRVFVFDVQSARRVRESRPVRGDVVGLEFSPDGRSLLVGSEDRRIVEIDARAGTVGRQQRTEKRVRSLDLSPDGRLVVWAGDDGAIEVLNSRLMRQDVLESPNMFRRRLAFTAFGIQGTEVFAASSDDARSAFWVLGEEDPIRRDERDREEYTAFAKDGDGQLLALGVKSLRVGLARTSALGPVGGAGGDVQDRDQDVRDRVVERALGGGFGGRGFVSAIRSVRILDWNRGRIVREIESLPDDVRALAVSPDRSIVVIALDNGDMGGYSTQEARRIMSIHEGDRVNAVRFSPGGAWLAAGTDRGGVMLWEMSGSLAASTSASPNLVQQGDVLATAARYEFTTGSEPLITATDRYTMAVLDLDNLGVDESLAASVMNLVVSRLANAPLLDLVERGDVQQVLDELRFQNTGITSPRDAAEIGRLLNARHVLLGNVNQLGTSLTVALRLVETESGRVLGAREILCRQCRPEDLPQGMSLLVGSLIQMNPATSRP